MTATSRMADELQLQSDDEAGSQNSGYDSEAHDVTRKRRGDSGRVPPRKRPRTSSVPDAAGPADQSDAESIAPEEPVEINDPTPFPDDRGDENVEQPLPSSPKPKTKPSPLGPISAKSVAAALEAEKRTGVIYLSRIPPYMKPSTLRSLLSPFGPTLRLFLTPEPSALRTQRLRSSLAANPNKRPLYTDGWLEFVSKSDARLCAETLNGRTLNEGEGGKRKGGWYADDVWSVRYLRGFKWRDLVEQRRGEEEERAGRLRAEEREGRRADRGFVRGLERARETEGMGRTREAKARARGGAGAGAGTGTGAGPGKAAVPESTGRAAEPRRPAAGFAQHRVVDPVKRRRGGGEEQVRDVLAKLF